MTDHDVSALPAHLANHLVPGSLGVSGSSAPVLVEQVERGPEMEGGRVPEGAAGVGDPVLGELAGVEAQPILDVRRSRLRRPDVEMDDPPHVANSAPSAVTTRDGLGRPSWLAIHTLVDTSLARSTPVSIPMPCSIQTRSSVARLPVADSA